MRFLANGNLSMLLFRGYSASNLDVYSAIEQWRRDSIYFARGESMRLAVDRRRHRPPRRHPAELQPLSTLNLAREPAAKFERHRREPGRSSTQRRQTVSRTEGAPPCVK